MRYATVGTSWITESFISASKTVENTELIAVYSRDRKKAKEFKEKTGALLYFDSLEKLAESEEFDSVYIASPNKCHYEQSKFFLQHGKNVICEKPATTTSEQMKELISLAESKNLVYTEAIMTIHTEGFDIIKENLKHIGSIHSAHFDFYQLSSKYNLYLEGKNPNIFNPEMHTGCLMDIGVYNLYLAVALFGKPDNVISDAIKLPNGCDATGSAILRYPDLSVVLNYSKVGQTYSYSEIIGDKGTIMFSSVSQLTGMYLKTKNSSEILVEDDVSRDCIMSGEIRFFKELTATKDFNNKKYIFAKETALSVRNVCDRIRHDNGFSF